MTLEELKKIPLLQTRSIAEACKGSEETFGYIVDCLNRFWAGDYGEVPQEDTDANNADLRAGCGHILARYKARHELEGDIYIEAHIDTELEGIDYNNTMIMYCSER